MYRISLYLLFLFSFIASNAVAQTYDWVMGGGSPQSLTSEVSEAVYFMCTDPNGNVYALSVVGTDPITADTFFRPTGAFGSPKNVLFTSHNCFGQMRFAKLISANYAIAFGVTADNSGHVYLGVDLPHYGSSSATTLRLGYDTTITEDPNNRVAFIQYDTSGNLNWIRYAGEDLLSTFTGMGGGSNYVAIDGIGNAHLIAHTKYGVHLSASLVSHNGYYDHEYDAAGNLLSIKKLDLDTTLEVYGLTIDKQSEKMYAYGFRDMGAFPGSSFYSFISALDVNRDRMWIDTFSNPFFNNGYGLGGIVADGYGHLYITPNSHRALVYRGDTTTNTIAAGASKISGIMKLDTAGSLIWKNISSGLISTNSLFNLTLLPNNKIATTGVMTSKVVNGLDTMNIFTGEGQNTLVFVVDSAGYTQAFQQLHGLGFYDRGNVCAADNVGNLYIGGKVETNIWAGGLTPYTSVGGDSDYFIMKYGVDCGCTAMPVANYSYSGTDLTRSFTYTGTAGIDSVRWLFGDGTTSTSMSPVHTYTGSGTFTTCVRVYSPCGNDMRCHEIEVSCTSVPSAAYADTGNYVHGFMYTGTTTAFYDSLRWDFNDGTFDTGLNVIHTYAVADTYHVCAKVYTRCGTDTFCTDVIVLDTTTTVSALQLVDYEVKVFPNPTTHELSVSGMPTSSHYRILSAIGVTLQSGSLSRGTNTLPTATLPPAMYLLEITAANGSRKLLKFIKQ